MRHSESMRRTGWQPGGFTRCGFSRSTSSIARTGVLPGKFAPEDVVRYREHIAERKAREEAGERDGWGPGADTSGASGITSRKNGVAQRSKLRDAHRWPTCTSES
jgi:hypothetical protein